MPPTAITPPPTLDAFLKALQRKGYLEQAGEAAGGGARAGAAGAAAQTAEGGTDIEWQWGPRADAEIGEKAVARFLFDMYVWAGLLRVAVDLDADTADPALPARNRLATRTTPRWSLRRGAGGGTAQQGRSRRRSRRQTRGGPRCCAISKRPQGAFWSDERY